MGGVALDAHAAAAAVALLAAPQLAVDELLIHRHTGGKTADQGDETLAVAFTCCRKSKHPSLSLEPGIFRVQQRL